LENGSLYPPLNTIQACSLEIAEKVIEYAYENNLATVRPKPENIRKFIKDQTYETSYKSAIPPTYNF
jgi:malate dehydrogenase (oxaloacetate-decarboxylating)(NADP+)